MVEFVVIAVDVGRGLLPSDTEPFHQLSCNQAAFPESNQLNSAIAKKRLVLERGHGSGLSICVAGFWMAAAQV